jgi:hypothetical protein
MGFVLGEPLFTLPEARFAGLEPAPAVLHSFHETGAAASGLLQSSCF